MLSLIFFLVCYATSILLFLGGEEGSAKPSYLDFPAFLPLAIADILLIIGFILFELKMFKMKINIPLIIVFSSLFIVNLVVIVTTPLVNTFSYIYMDNPGTAIVTITNEYKITYLLCFFLLLLNIYISFNYLLFRVKFKKQFIWICFLGIVIGLIMVLYSYIAEWNQYKALFENASTYSNPKSLTNNPNNYGAILLGAAFCCYGLYVATKKHLFWIIGLFFCINTIFPMSRICLFLSVVLSLSIFIYSMVISWKEHKFRNLNLIFLVLLGLGMCIAICLTTIQIRESFFKSGHFLDSRLPLWRLTIDITKEFHVFIGNGHGYYNTVFTIIMVGEVRNPHNLYVQTYGALGFVGVTLLAVLICFAIYKIIRLYKNNRDASLISVIGLIIVLTYYLVEG